MVLVCECALYERLLTFLHANMACFLCLTCLSCNWEIKFKFVVAVVVVLSILILSLAIEATGSNTACDGLMKAF